MPCNNSNKNKQCENVTPAWPGPGISKRRTRILNYLARAEKQVLTRDLNQSPLLLARSVCLVNKSPIQPRRFGSEVVFRLYQVEDYTSLDSGRWGRMWKFYCPEQCEVAAINHFSSDGWNVNHKGSTWNENSASEQKQLILVNYVRYTTQPTRHREREWKIWFRKVVDIGSGVELEYRMNLLDTSCHSGG